MTFAPQKILVPVAVELGDDMELAAAAVDHAISLAKAFGGSVILYAAGPSFHPYLGPEAGVAGMTPSYEALREILKQRNEALEARITSLASATDVPISTVVDHEHKGSISKAICAAIEDHGADMVVIPSHGRRGVARALLGSVAERVAHIASVPVLLLRL